MCQLPQASSLLYEGTKFVKTEETNKKKLLEMDVVSVPCFVLRSNGRQFSFYEQEIMFKKLLYAISEGQGSFDLS